MPNQVLHVHFQETVETFSLVEGKMIMSTIPNIFFFTIAQSYPIK